jgi:hypothetical protein
MSQHYVDPNSVRLGVAPHTSRRLVKIIEQDGQIVPVLVRTDNNGFYVDDQYQADRVFVFRQLKWPTILVEDSWSDSDL